MKQKLSNRLSDSEGTLVPEPKDSGILLSPEQKRDDFSRRLANFQIDLKELLGKHKLAMKAQITPDGPVINIADVST